MRASWCSTLTVCVPLVLRSSSQALILVKSSPTLAKSLCHVYSYRIIVCLVMEGPVLILPAIDIRGGKCVRLRQGDYAQETVFGADPAAMARRWVGLGAAFLHLVDLDGARAGRPV